MVNLYYGTTINTVDSPIVNYESLIWTERYNSYGDFELVMAYDDSIFSDFVPGKFFVHSSESTKVMIGDRLELENGVITITGRDLSWILNRRWRVEADDSNVNITDRPHERVSDLLSDSITEGWHWRRIPEFRDRGVFWENTSAFNALPRMNYQQRYSNTIYSLVEEIAKAHDFGFRADWNPSSETIDWQLYFGVDRSTRSDALHLQTVILSPKLDNLVDGRYVISDEDVANDGVGLGRTVNDPKFGYDLIVPTRPPFRQRPTGWDRYETVLDYSSEYSYDPNDPLYTHTEFQDAIRSRGLLHIDAYRKPRPTYDGKLTDLGPYKYGTHFNMGDVLLLITEFGHETRSRVVEYTTSVNDEGTTSYPTLESVRT